VTVDYPYLSLSRVTIDSDLARRLPRRLAYYHLALPLAEDADELTVVMAHPENQAVVTMLEMLLSARIVPVLGTASEIKAALDGIWRHEPDTSVLRIVSWGSTPEQADLARLAAEQLALPLSVQVTTLDGSQCDLDTVLTVAREGQYSLIVINGPTGDPLTRFLREAPTSVLILQAVLPQLDHILVALRGHSPDTSALNWAIPMAKPRAAAVTLLAVTSPAQRSPVREIRTRHSLATLLDSSSGPGEHIAACTRRLNDTGIQGRLRLCQGAPEPQIAHQFISETYNLLIIAAEAHGDFVQQVLRCIQQEAPSHDKAVLIVKPLAD
jgi:nucleotide-binding universal stress UspA family protein